MTENTINNDMTMGGATGTLLAGRYRVVRQLGQGGMGSVWLAEDMKLDGFKVAIKMLPSVLANNKRAYAQVKAEALVSLKLSHPNIATVRAFEEESGSPFLVMDYIDGQTLDDYLAEKGKLTEEETIRLMKPVAAALDYAHTQGVVHRDVKPGNIMIRKDGMPFVLDFGIAREIQETMTRVTGKLSSGTLLYMSPEQLNGEAPKPAQDIYSFAAMAYECLKGEPPFSRGQIEYQIVNNKPEPLGPQFANCGSGVMAGLAKTPEIRPSTCAAVLRAGALPRSQPSISAERNERPGAMAMPTSVRCVRRVRTVRWLSLVLFLIAGFAVSFAVSHLAPAVYEAKSEFTIDLRHENDKPDERVATERAQLNGFGENVFNTRLSEWRSEKIVAKIVQQCHVGDPASKVSDKELLSMIEGASLELLPNSRKVEISVRSKVPALCAAIANAYAETIEQFTDEDNKFRCDKAVAQIHGNVEKQRRQVDKIAKQIVDFRTANKVDDLRLSRETIQRKLSKATADVLGLEGEECQLIELEKMLLAVQKDPDSYASLEAGCSRALEIAAEFKTYQEALGEYRKFSRVYTEAHPEVITSRRSMDSAKRGFLDAVARALLTARSVLQVTRNQLVNLKSKQDELNEQFKDVARRIVLAESGLQQLEAEHSVANDVCKGLQLDESKARKEAVSGCEIVRVGRQATVPLHPVSPRPAVIYALGLAVAFSVWIVIAFGGVICRR